MVDGYRQPFFIAYEIKTVNNVILLKNYVTTIILETRIFKM